MPLPPAHSFFALLEFSGIPAKHLSSSIQPFPPSVQCEPSGFGRLCLIAYGEEEMPASAIVHMPMIIGRLMVS
jgi:hypothetical protein